MAKVVPELLWRTMRLLHVCTTDVINMMLEGRSSTVCTGSGGETGEIVVSGAQVSPRYNKRHDADVISKIKD